jgi:toxin YoeB
VEIIYKSEALEDIKYWKTSGNVQIQQKISELIHHIELHPTTGIGKPEMLKHELSGKWSRRINKEHRIIYKIHNDEVHILSLRGHYFDK